MGSDKRCRKPGCGARRGRCSDWDCPEGDFVRMYEGRTDERATEARDEGEATYHDSAIAVRLLPEYAARIEEQDREIEELRAALADRVVRAPEAREALRERIAEECWIAGAPATYEHEYRRRWRERDPSAGFVARIHYTTADRILALLSALPDAPGGEREPDAWALVDQADRLLAGVFGDTSWGRDVGLWRAKVDEARALRPDAPPETPPVVVDPSVPPGEVHFRQGGRKVGKITGVEP